MYGIGANLSNISDMLFEQLSILEQEVFIQLT